MAFDGNGNFSLIYNWVNDKNNNIPITASRMDGQEEDMANNGFGLCLTRDGQGSASSNLPMNGYIHTTVGAATMANQYAPVGQIQTGEFLFGIAGGTSDAITASFTPSIAALVNGMQQTINATAANTTASPTYSPDGLTARTITKFGGQPLEPGDISGVGHRLLLSYSASTTQWELLNPANSASLGANISLPQTEIPLTGPTATLNAVAGNLTGSYTYSVTYVTATGETDRGVLSNTVATTAQRINLTNIPVSSDPAVIARNIYRTIGSPADPVLQSLLATLSDNTTTTYADNTADGSLGVGVPYINTTGGQIFIGGDRFLAEGTQSLGIGQNVLPFNTGYSNVGVGGNSLSANTSGYRNTALGLYALEMNTTGFNNTAGGVHSQGAGTTAFANTSWGYASMINNTIGSQNCAFGSQSLESASNVSSMVAIGFQAMQASTTASNNVAVGAFALAGNVTATQCVAVGYQALKVSTGADNTAVGNGSGFRVTSGIQNTLFGSTTATGITTGGNNCIFGYSAGASLDTQSDNTMFGALSGVNATSAGNVFLGKYAGFYETTAGNRFMVDNQIRTNQADARDKSLLYGIMDATKTNQSLVVNGDLVIGQSRAPLSSDAGIPGTITTSGAFVYVCIASGNWGRAALVTGY